MKSFFNRGTILFFIACCVLGGVYGLVSAYSKARSPEQVRKRGLVGGHKACVDVAKRTLAKAGETAPDSMVDQYCTCAVGRALDAMTDQQVLDVDAGRTHTKDVLGTRYPEIVRSCVQEARSAAGLPMLPGGSSSSEVPAGSPLAPAVPLSGPPADAPSAPAVRP